METALLQIEGIGFSYGEKQVLSGVSLEVGASDCVVLAGPNGGGKTTLLRLMAGLLKPDSGRIVRRRELVVGYLPQYRSIDRKFPITVREVVLSGLQNRKRFWQGFSEEQQLQAEAILEQLGLLPLAGRKIEDLSGGQWQRVLLARALVSQPGLLLLDEPDTHLDAASKEQLYALLDRWRPSCSMVLVSHDARVGMSLPGCRVLSVGGGRVEALSGM